LNILTPQLYFSIAWSAAAIVVTLCLWVAVEIWNVKSSPLHNLTDERSLHNVLSLTPTRAVELIENGADVNVADRDGNTPLNRAIEKSHIKEMEEIAKALIENGADVNMANKNGYTPLHLAVRQNPTEIAPLLIEKGADVNMANKRRVTPLTLAVQYNRIPLVEQLLQAGAHRALPMYPDLGNHEMCKILLENEVRLVPRGRDAFLAAFQTYDWWSQDHTAILNNEVPEIQDHTLELHSLLKLAILCGNLDATKALIENADTNIKNACAFIAAHAGQKDIVAHILETHPKPTEIVNSQGQTLLHLAAATGQADLLAMIANINIATTNREPLCTM
jgi:ankyrin repeat protein